MHLKSKETKITRDTDKNILAQTFTRYALFTSTVVQAQWINKKVYIYIYIYIYIYTAQKFELHPHVKTISFDQPGIRLLGARGKRQIMGKKKGEQGEKGRPFDKPIASGAFVFAKISYTDIPANPRNVITLRRRGSPSPLFPPLPPSFRRLPRRLAPGALKPLFFMEKNC